MVYMNFSFGDKISQSSEIAFKVKIHADEKAAADLEVWQTPAWSAKR